MSKGGFQTETHRRLMRGESIPAWRPGSCLQPTISPAEFAAGLDAELEAEQAAHMRSIRPAVVPLGRDIPAADARAAALRVREGLGLDSAEIDTRDLVTLARWVIHQTKENP